MMGWNRKNPLFGAKMLLHFLILSIFHKRSVHSLLLSPQYHHNIVPVSPKNVRQIATQPWNSNVNSSNRRLSYPSLSISSNANTGIVEEVEDNEESSLTLSRGEKLSLRAKLNRNFLTIAAPAFVQLTSEPLASLVDTAYLGRLGPEVLGGAGMPFPNVCVRVVEFSGPELVPHCFFFGMSYRFSFFPPSLLS
jgi:hypothetical protein